MNKQSITFKADEQKLIKTGGINSYASNIVAYIEATFELGENWTGYDSVRAVWSNDYLTDISTVLDPNGRCIVPTEVLTDTGNVTVNLVGSISVDDELTDRLTTYPCKALTVDEDAKVEGEETESITPSQFEQFVEIVHDEVEQVTGMTAEAETLPAGSDATASYSDGVLSLGIPKGDKGDQGEQGETGHTGEPAGFGNVTASVDNTVGTPSVHVTASGPDTAKEFDFEFHNLKGDKGDTGETGATGNGIASTVLNPDYTLTITFTDGASYTTPSIRGAKGDTGDTGATGNGIQSTVLNADYTLTITFTDGTSYTTPSIRGEQGPAGPVSDVQVNGTSVVDQNGIAHVASAVKLSDKLDFYLYRTNAYINDSGAEVALNGYDIYKFPVSRGDVLRIEQTTGAEKFFGGISAGYVLHIQQGNVISQMSTAGTTYAYWRGGNGTRSELKVYTPEGVSAVYVSIKRGNESFITFMINRPLPDVSAPALIHQYNTVYTVEESNSMVGHIYARNSDIGSITTAGYSVRTIPVKTGDKVTVSQKATGISYWGKYVKASEIQTTDMVGNDITQMFTVPEDGVMDFFFYTGDTITVTVYPADAITIDWSNIKNVPDSANPFSGLNAVAFGTSLTYRAISSYGYLQYLPALSEMTFDNQGVGSSSILPHTSTTNMLNAIKNYTSYSNKRVCILEGFVNDWYYNATSALLGDYTDNTETTVCGCVRSALNYIMAQNANITVFLVLDPYGRLYNSIDCRSVALNSGGITQYEYYEKIAKVAESMGVHVIRLYSFSGISEATPQYILDNIHPTALGAEQTAYAIWSKMKTCYPNRIV